MFTNVAWEYHFPKPIINVHIIETSTTISQNHRLTTFFFQEICSKLTHKDVEIYTLMKGLIWF
jgi:hypothetical protein